MPGFDRSQFRYTPFFCEENIWWLAKDLVQNHPDANNMQVLFLTNPDQSIALINQKNAASGHATIWDYHVILLAQLKQQAVIFDFDSMLDFPVAAAQYATYTFPKQDDIAARYRSWIRSVKAQAFVQQFHSDRSHMADHIGSISFPPDPPINPQSDNAAIDLSEYRDFNQPIDNSVVYSLDDFLAIQAWT